MSIQSTLRQLRREQGMTMSELSRLSGVSRTYISELEAGKATDPSVAVVTALSSALGVSPALMISEPEASEAPDVPASLLAAVTAGLIPESDVSDLARVRFRNYQPTSPEDWKFLYDAIRRSLPKDADIE